MGFCWQKGRAEGVMNLGADREQETAQPSREHAQWPPPPISKSCPSPLLTQTTQTEAPNSLDVWQGAQWPGLGSSEK